MFNLQRPLQFSTSLFIGLSLFTVSSSSLAHSRLVQSVPAVESKLAKSPSHLQLVFADPVILAGLQLYRQQQQMTLPFKVSPSLNRQFQIAMPALSQGLYTVKWKTLGADGHAMNGTYTFTIQ